MGVEGSNGKVTAETRIHLFVFVASGDSPRIAPPVDPTHKDALPSLSWICYLGRFLCNRRLHNQKHPPFFLDWISNLLFCWRVVRKVEKVSSGAPTRPHHYSLLPIAALETSDPRTRVDQSFWPGNTKEDDQVGKRGESRASLCVWVYIYIYVCELESRVSRH